MLGQGVAHQAGTRWSLLLHLEAVDSPCESWAANNIRNTINVSSLIVLLDAV